MAHRGGAVLTRRRPSPRPALALAALVLLAAPAAARDLLGVYGTWAAFRDPAVPRCYAIALSAHAAAPGASARGQPAALAYADIGNWPARGLRGQFHAHLAHRVAANAAVALSVNHQHIRLTAAGADVWAPDARADAAITAALRSAPAFSIAARDAATGRLFVETWPLDGVATAMDAALVGCAAPR